MSASALALNPFFHAQTKHIEVDIHFVYDKVLEKKLEVRYVPSQGQVADCLTEPLSHSQFSTFQDQLGVVLGPSLPSSLQGAVKT